MCKSEKKELVKGIDDTARNDFYWSYTDEPHATRRKLIRAAHPEIDELCKPDPRPIPFVLGIILSQLLIAYFQKDWSWAFFVLIAYSYGGAASHSLSLMTHELSHNLVFKNVKLNEYFGIFCNVGMGFPASTRFKKYHMEHHQFQGDDKKDCDLPTAFEGRFVGNNTFLKAIWVFLMPLTYSTRPLFVRPKALKFMDQVNIYTIYASNACIFYFCGWRGWLYIVGSTVLGMGLHPCAGHFIGEHCVFDEGHETYSYYGALNLICWNVGYHNEHHDFPRVPGWKLPLVRAMAPEFYEHLPHHKSWSYVIWRFITDPKISPYCRMRRDKNREKKIETDKDTSVPDNDPDNCATCDPSLPIKKEN
mmetsp:Transcript_5641/g.5842  ORF Transcript_5641/g.5842 Transcript_5641/m.5842 type:complete len:362 (+) Transcript_5641:54-1139(+)